MSNQINDGGAAFPVPDSHHANGQVQYGSNGMTLRQYAAIKLRVPDSGTDWLDAMIMQAIQDKFAGQALAGEVTTHQLSNTEGKEEGIAERCYALADAMLTARNQPQ